jgi:hypothetical protein
MRGSFNRLFAKAVGLVRLWLYLSPTLAGGARLVSTAVTWHRSAEQIIGNTWHDFAPL